MRTRPLYLAALAVALLGLAAFLVVPYRIARAGRADEARARAIASRLPDPVRASARPMRDCVVGVLRCMYVTRDTDRVAAEMAASLRAVSGTSPRVQCLTLDHGGVRGRDCTVAVDTGHGHAVFVFAHTSFRVTGGTQRADGTDVGVFVD